MLHHADEIVLLALRAQIRTHSSEWCDPLLNLSLLLLQRWWQHHISLSQHFVNALKLVRLCLPDHMLERLLQLHIEEFLARYRNLGIHCAAFFRFQDRDGRGQLPSLILLQLVLELRHLLLKLVEELGFDVVNDILA